MTTGLRPSHLCGNVSSGIPIIVRAFDLSLVTRQLFGKGTPRSLQGLLGGEFADVVTALRDGSDADRKGRRMSALFMPPAS